MFTAEEMNIINQANAIIDSKINNNAAITSPDLAARLVRTQIAHLEHEVFLVIFLDNQNRLIAMDIMFRGTIDSSAVYPREVAKVALAHNAAAVIFAHNHPSGITDPSRADQVITQRLIEALALFDIRVLDHFIVGSGETFSFSERGLL